MLSTCKFVFVYLHRKRRRGNELWLALMLKIKADIIKLKSYVAI